MLMVPDNFIRAQRGKPSGDHTPSGGLVRFAMNTGTFGFNNNEEHRFSERCVKSKSKENNASTGMLRVRYAELQQLRKQVEQLESRDSSGLGEPGMVRSDNS
jgi:hypothetical protein